MPSRDRQRGQSAAELVALLPAVVALALAAWWIVATAHAWTLAGGAARAGARAREVGAPAAAAARATLPGGRAAGARVEELPGGRVTVRVRGPGLGPLLPALEVPVTAGGGPGGRPR
jgi:hypothetical protein